MRFVMHGMPLRVPCSVWCKGGDSHHASPTSGITSLPFLIILFLFLNNNNNFNINGLIEILQVVNIIMTGAYARRTVCVCVCVRACVRA